jgi:hypothetical protein
MAQAQWSSAFRAALLSSSVAGAQVAPKGYPAGADRPAGVAGFQIIREVGNFEVLDPRGAPVQGSSRVRLTVEYSSADVAAAGGDKASLKLGVYLNGRWQVRSWSQLSDMNPGSPTAGRVEADVEGLLADPPVAWGGG